MSKPVETVINNGFKRFTISHVNTTEGDDSIKLHIKELFDFPQITAKEVHCYFCVSETEELIRALQHHVDMIRDNW